MKTFEVENGDFVIGPGGFSTVSGIQKAYQDLSILVREPYGVDRFHPQWGGILGDFIGNEVSGLSQSHIRSEIQRLIQNYIIMQSRQMLADKTMGRKPRYGPGEVIESIEGIHMQQTFDRINIKVTVRTVSGESLNIFRGVEV